MNKITHDLCDQSSLASDRWAWLHTHGFYGIQKEIGHPINQTNWGTIATCGATSWIHLDDNGFQTSTQPLTGAKYWVTFSPDDTANMELGHGNMSSIHFCPELEDFLDHKLKGYFKAEADLIWPGDIL